MNVTTVVDINPCSCVEEQLPYFFLFLFYCFQQRCVATLVPDLRINTEFEKSLNYQPVLCYDCEQ